MAILQIYPPVRVPYFYATTKTNRRGSSPKPAAVLPWPRLLAMMLNRNHFIAPREREALIFLTAISYIEEHGLFTAAQLDDAKKSLQALFLRASGEETMLRQLIEVLKTTRRIHHSFASISGTLSGVSKCADVVEEKVAHVRVLVAQSAVTAEAHTDFVGPFLSFSQQFVQETQAFAERLAQYLNAREQHARAQSLYQIALDARERLRLRLAGRLGQASGEAELRIKDELVSSFDYGEAGLTLESTEHDARAMERDVQDHLREIQRMCSGAMNPALRDRLITVDPETDVFTRFAKALPRHACLPPIKDSVLELFKLYQHSHGMFQLDYQKLNRALDTMMSNAIAYFQAKVEDHDLTTKRERLRRIEGLIPFLEQAAHLADDDSMAAYSTFSRQLSATISERRAQWAHVAEDLLRAKVQAEAEISTRL